MIHLESQDLGAQNITGSPFWHNLIDSDMTAENLEAVLTEWSAKYSIEERRLWATANDFTQLLAQEQFSYEEMKQFVFEPTINDWGDFSDVTACYKTIPSPGISTTIRYNEQRDAAFVHIYPHVEEGFIVDSPQIISDVYVVTLIKDQRINEWRVFAFGGRLDPHIRR